MLLFNFGFQDPESLQRHLDDLQNSFELWRIKIDTDKCVQITFTPLIGISSQYKLTTISFPKEMSSDI